MEADRQKKFAIFNKYLQKVQDQVKFQKPENNNTVNGEVVCVMQDEGYIFSNEVGFVHFRKVAFKDEDWPLECGQKVIARVRKNRGSAGPRGTFFCVNLRHLVKYVIPEWYIHYTMDPVEDHLRKMFDGFDDFENFIYILSVNFPWINKPKMAKVRSLMNQIKALKKPREHLISCYDLWKGLNSMFGRRSQDDDVSVLDEFTGCIVSLMQQDGLIFCQDVGLVYFHMMRTYWNDHHLHAFPKKIEKSRLRFNLAPFNPEYTSVVLKDVARGILNVRLGNVIKFKAIRVWVEGYAKPSLSNRKYKDWRNKKDPDTFMKECYQNWIDSNALATDLKTLYLDKAETSAFLPKTTPVVLQEIKMPNSAGQIDKFEEDLKPIIKFCPTNEGILDIAA